jgi:hypothetical protein
MAAAIALPIAHHGSLIAALPFFAPALLIVGTILAMRLAERRRHDSESES